MFGSLDPRELNLNIKQLDSAQNLDQKRLADYLKELEDDEVENLEQETGAKLSKKECEEVKWRIRLELSRRKNQFYSKMSKLVKNNEEIYVDSMDEFFLKPSNYRLNQHDES